MNITHYNFRHIINHLQDHYDVTMNEEDFENIALYAWQIIGNRRTKLYRLTKDTINKTIELPCNLDIIESIHSGTPDYQRTSNVRDNNNFFQHREAVVDARADFTHPLYHPGKLLNYRQEGGLIVFDKDYFGVTIVYRGVIADEDGLPIVNFKELQAISAYCAYTHYYKKALITKDQSLMQIAKDIQQTWKRTCANARTPELMTQNEMDEILDVMYSWDRKRYGISFKPVTT